MSVSPTPSAPAPANSRSRVITASLVGTTIEFYDFYVYATAAVLVFPVLFFPTGDDTTALLSSFAVFGAAMVARPIGAVVFGHFGDRFGRKATLVASLLTMGIATFLIGCLPTYQNIGWWAALLLLFLRLAQGFALGGEWSGAALVATENAPEGKRAWYGTFPQLGAPIGFIIANGVFLVINFALPHPDGTAQRSEEFLAWGWRVPFLFSAVMVIIGLWVRLKLVESDSFVKAEKVGAIRRFPLGAVLRRHWWQLILGTFIMLATYVLFYLMTSFTLSYGTKATTDAAATAAEAAGTPFDAATYVPGLGFAYTDFVIMQIIGVVFFGIFTLLSGPIADRVGRRTLLIWVTVAIIVFGYVQPVPDAVRRPEVHRRAQPGVPHPRLHAHGCHVRPDGRDPARAVPDERALHRLRDRLQRLLDPRCRRGADHRGRTVGGGGRRALARGRVPLGRGRADSHRADPVQGDEGRGLHRRPRRGDQRRDVTGGIRPPGLPHP